MKKVDIMFKNFIRFLKSENAYAKYKINLFNPSVKSNIKTFFLSKDNVLINKVSGSYICGAFNWRKSKEGYNYWRDLDEKWSNKLSNYDIY